MSARSPAGSRRGTLCGSRSSPGYARNPRQRMWSADPRDPIFGRRLPSAGGPGGNGGLSHGGGSLGSVEPPDRQSPQDVHEPLRILAILPTPLLVQANSRLAADVVRCSDLDLGLPRGGRDARHRRLLPSQQARQRTTRARTWTSSLQAPAYAPIHALRRRIAPFSRLSLSAARAPPARVQPQTARRRCPWPSTS